MRADTQTLEAMLRPIVPDRVRTAILDRLTADAAAATDAGPAALALNRRWPTDVAPQDVVDWLTKHAPDRAEAERLCAAILAMFDALGQRTEHDAAGARAVVLDEPDPGDLAYSCSFAARAFQAWRAIQRDLQRPALAVDAGREHHDLVSGMRDFPKDKKPRMAKVFDGRVEVMAPDGRSVQLALVLDRTGGLHQATIETLREWRGWEGVRHWAALQRLFSVEGGRSGSVRWTLDAHLDALGYADRARRDPAIRKRVASEVELLTKLELAVYAPDGSLRARQPLIAVGTKYDALRGSEWALEGMELRVNEWLYRGVRDPKTGELGSDWHPAPVELAQIDHARFPHAIVLGLILPIRWRWDLGKRDHCALSGATLLATAGIPYNHHNTKRAWEALHRNLDELRARDGLGRYEWDGEPWTLTAVCRLYPPQWVRDRVIHRIVPHELPLPPAVATGRELRKWREERHWTQAQAARALGVGERTLRLAESTPDKPLGGVLREAFQRFQPPAKAELADPRTPADKAIEI
jgi:hypothetical protein